METWTFGLLCQSLVFESWSPDLQCQTASGSKRIHLSGWLLKPLPNPCISEMSGHRRTYSVGRWHVTIRAPARPAKGQRGRVAVPALEALWLWLPGAAQPGSREVHPSPSSPVYKLSLGKDNIPDKWVLHPLEKH